MDRRSVNVIGALTVALHDLLADSVQTAAGRSGAAAAVLVTTLGQPGIAVVDLAAATGISSSGVVRLLDDLTAQGLVTRNPGRDGRSVAVHLTRAGARTARRVLDERERALAGVLGVLDKEQLAALGAIGEHLVAAMTVDDATGWRICRWCDVAACPQERCPVEQATT